MTTRAAAGYDVAMTRKSKQPDRSYCAIYPKECGSGRPEQQFPITDVERGTLPEDIRSLSLRRCAYCGCVYTSDGPYARVMGKVLAGKAGSVFHDWRGKPGAIL